MVNDGNVHRHRIWLALVTMLAACCVPDIARAAAVNSLYGSDIGNCEAPGLENLFSGFVCTYQEILDEVMTNVYWTMLNYFQQPFFAISTIFLAAMGSTFALGMLPVTTKDLSMILAKIAVINGFAMYPDLLIGLVYEGLIGFMRQTTDIIIAQIAPQDSVTGIFEWMDFQLYDFLTVQDQAQTEGLCRNDVLALLFAFAVTMPPVFAMAIYIFVQLIMVLLRTVLGYLLAITGIMFLTTLAPIFLSFAFFEFTKSYFDKWVKHLTGFSVQIFVVFSFVGVVLSLPFSSKLKGVMDTVKPYDKVVYHDGQRLDFNNWCTMCVSGAEGELTDPDTCVGDAITPTNMQVGGIGEFIDWIGEELLILGVMAYIVETVLRTAPEVAKFITGVIFAPKLGESALPPGAAGLAQSGEKMLRGIASGKGGMPNRTRATLDAFSQQVGRR